MSLPTPRAQIDALESHRLRTVLSRIGYEEYYGWILEKNQTRADQGKLVSLDFSWLPIRHLPPDFLEGLVHLKEFRFDNNPQCVYDENCFASKSLEKLKLRYCKLSDFPVHIVPLDNNLRELDMSNNPLTNIKSKSFLRLHNLEVLNLKQSQIKRINKTSFQGLSKLRGANLDGNQIGTLKASIFDHLSNLEKLYIRDNRIRNVSKYTLNGLQKLKELYLDINELQDLPKLSELSQLETVSVQHNQLTTLSDQLNNLPKLSSVNLELNLLEKLDTNVFDESCNIIHLALASNQITDIHRDIFARLTQLEFVTIQNNPLSMETALTLPQFARFNYAPMISQIDPETLHEIIITYPENQLFIEQAIISGKLLDKTRAFIRLLESPE